MQSRFEEQEVLRCLKMCAMDKAPGPDGFTMGFFIKCYEMLKKHIMGMFHNFHSHAFFERSFNETYIALTPKKNSAKELMISDL